MNRVLTAVLAVTIVAASAEAATLFRTPTRSTWDVSKNGTAAGKVELASSGTMVRADWAPKSGAPSTLIGRDGKVWVRQNDGDVELSAAKSEASGFLPALLLPASAGRVQESGGQVSAYTFGSSNASYKWDGSGPATVTVKDGSTTWTLQRSAVKPGSIAAATFEVRPKQGRGGRLASMAGNLLGGSNREVSTTAGVSGVDPKGIKLQDGGDWTALEAAESMNDEFNDAAALAEFQKAGKVGAAGGNQ